MKKILLSICLLCTYGLQMQAQELLQSKKFDEEGRMVEMLTLPDGYIVAGHHYREEQRGHVIYGHKRPFVQKLDQQLQVVWEQSFEESTLPLFTSLVQGEDGNYYVFGNYYANGSNKSEARLIKISPQGEILMQKRYTYPGYHSVEGFDLLALPGGDIVAMTRIYPNYNSYGSPWMLRLSAQGEKKWTKVLGSQYYQLTPGQMVLSSSNTILMLGSCSQDKSQYQNGESKGWIAEIDMEDPSNVLFEKSYSDLYDMTYRDAIELESGGWWILGTARIAGNRNHYGTLLELGPDKTVLRERKLEMEDGIFPINFCWNPYRQRIEIAGYSGTHPSWNATYLSLDPSWQRVSRYEGPRKPSRQISVRPDGTLVLLTQNEMQILN